MLKKILCLTLIAVIVFSSLSVAVVLGENVVYYGSNKSHVKLVQQKLKQWGYYKGEVTGIFNYETEEAVKYFQRKNGLTVDGKAGQKTLDAMGLGYLKDSYSDANNNSSSNASGSYDADVELLARCINGEARGEPYIGQVAVGAVILNRVEDAGFPNTISGVVYQNGAFDAVADGQIELSPTDSCVKAAKDALAGWDPTGGALFYYNPKTATNEWIRTRPIIMTIGNHVFCK